MTTVTLITGPPGIGKTTILCKVAETLSERGYKTGGMITREVREGGTRVGFKVRDYISGNEGWLAHVQQPTGPQIGRYRVNLHDLDSIGVSAITKALLAADIVLIDEIGPMELLSENFRRTLERTVDSSKPLLGSIHFRTHRQILRQLGADDFCEITQVTFSNRNHLPHQLVNKVLMLVAERTV